MLLEPITRTMIKIGLIVLCAYNVTVAQSQQVTMEIVMVFDALYILDQIPGEIIKASIKSYKKDEKEPNFSMGIKITRLDSETLNMNNFRVPKEYISIKK